MIWLDPRPQRGVLERAALNALEVPTGDTGEVGITPATTYPSHPKAKMRASPTKSSRVVLGDAGRDIESMG